jgi:hypothetical protein
VRDLLTLLNRVGLFRSKELSAILAAAERTEEMLTGCADLRLRFGWNLVKSDMKEGFFRAAAQVAKDVRDGRTTPREAVYLAAVDSVEAYLTAGRLERVSGEWSARGGALLAVSSWALDRLQYEGVLSTELNRWRMQRIRSAITRA